MLRAIEVTHPYPGLRPFEPHEAEIFFGREAHIDRLLEILQRERFLAVIGPSGCGKSSLVRAGLLPAVSAGWLGRGNDWRIVVMRPGDRPLAELARSLMSPEALGSELSAGGAIGHETALIEAELARGPRGLIDVFRMAAPRARDPLSLNLLVLIDQFEELFTYARAGEAQADESTAFVNLLLTSRAEREVAVHVVLTMRTDFLGHCVRFLELPDAINRAQFLTPRLNRDEMREAIVGPAILFDRSVDEQLVGHLINGVGGDSDQLPILQHALSRMWERAGSDPVLTSEHLNEVGGLGNALSMHATAVYDGLSERQKTLAEHLFRFVTGRTGPEDGSRDVRRPRSLQQIAAAKEGCDPSELVPVVKAFAEEGVNFLTYTLPLDARRKIDISHEALIRKWDKLQKWVTDEAQRAAEYREWRERALKMANKQADLLSGIELARALRWRDGEGGTAPDARWAARYASSDGSSREEFETTLMFIAESKAEDERRRVQEAKKELADARAKRMRQAMVVLVAFSLVIIGIAIFAWSARVEARDETLKAISAERKARAAEIKARAAEGDAATAAERAIDKAHEAETQRQRAVAAETEAGKNLHEAQREATRATRAEKEARGRATEALALQLVSQSEKYDKSDPDLAQLLAIEAYRTQATQDSASRVRTVRFAYPFLVAYRGHKSKVVDATFSPDGKTILTAGVDADDTVRLWQKDTGKALVTLQGSGIAEMSDALFSPDGRTFLTLGDVPKLYDTASGSVLQLLGEQAPVQAAFSPDGKTIVVVGDTVQLWEAGTGRAPLELEDSDGVMNAAFSPDGTKLVTTGDVENPRVWDVGNGHELAELKSEGSAANAAFSPDGKKIVTAGENGAGIWDAASGTSLEKLGQETVLSASFSPDGMTVVTASEDGTARIWNASTGAIRHQFKGHIASVLDAAFSHDGKTLATVSADGTGKVWATGDGRLLATLQGHQKGVVRVHYSMDDREILTASDDGTARLWRAGNARNLATLSGHVGKAAEGASYSTDSKSIVTAGSDGIARLWSGTGREIAEMKHEKGVTYATFSPDGRMIVTTSLDGTARLWDAQSGQTRATLRWHEGNEPPIQPAMPEPKPSTKPERVPAAPRTTESNPIDNARKGDSLTAAYAAFSPDSAIVATAGDVTPKLWGATNGSRSPIKTLAGHNSAVTLVAFSPDGERLVTASDHQVLLWQLPDCPPPTTLEGAKFVRSVAFSPDSRTLLMASNSGASLWDGRDGHSLDNLVRSFIIHAGFSPDGKSIVTAGGDGTARVWDLSTRKQQVTLRGHHGLVLHAIFSDDGKTIATTSQDRTARLWEAATGRLLETLEGHNGTVLYAEFSPDGNSLVTTSTDDTAKIWDVSAARQSINQMIEEIRRRVGRDLTDKERTESHLPLSDGTIKRR